MLIVLAGLPGTGKTTVAQELAFRLRAIHLRIDSIEQAIRDSSACPAPVELADAGYRSAYAIAGDNLRLGQTVIADSVNPIALTRDAWMDVGTRAGVRVIEVEIICSDVAEHRRRVETRAPTVAGLKLPTWAEVERRDYHPWTRHRLVIDTATHRPDDAAAMIITTINS